MNATEVLAAQLRVDGSEINVPRTLCVEAIRELLAAGLIADFDDDQQHADRRYIATEYAKDVIWGKLPKRGRPVLPTDEQTKPRSMRMTDARWEKLKRLGPDWLARTVDRAKETLTPPKNLL